MADYPKVKSDKYEECVCLESTRNILIMLCSKYSNSFFFFPFKLIPGIKSHGISKSLAGEYVVCMNCLNFIRSDFVVKNITRYEDTERYYREGRSQYIFVCFRDNNLILMDRYDDEKEYVEYMGMFYTITCEDDENNEFNSRFLANGTIFYEPAERRFFKNKAFKINCITPKNIKSARI